MFAHLAPIATSVASMCVALACAVLLHLPLPIQAQPVLDAPPACSWWRGRGVNVQDVGYAYLATWHCRSPDRYGPWLPQEAVVVPSALLPDTLAQLIGRAQANDFAGLVALRDRPLSDPLFLPARLQARYLTPPGPWVVAKNGTATTRPTRVMVGNVLGGQAAPRATVGTTLDCTRRAFSGTTLYCAVPGTDTAAVAAEVAP